MKLNFPIKKSIKCTNCRKEFELVIRDRNTQRHTCPSCGQGFTIASREFDAVEKKATKIAKEAFAKAMRDALRKLR